MAITIAVWPTTIQSRGLIAEIIESPPSYTAFTTASLPTVGTKPLKLAVVESYNPDGSCVSYVRSKRDVPWHGNASTWYEQAKQYSYIVGSTPEVGAIYVTRAENSLGTRSGHVGIVEKVESGQILISEQNYVGYGVVSQRWVSSEKLERDKVGFIY